MFGDLGLPYLRRTRKRTPRQLKLFEKAEPGESVQVDVKFVKIAGQWARFRVLRLYRRLYHGSSLAFLAELRRAFRIRRLQCDNGREFPLEFALAVEAAGIRHRYIRPQRPQQNGKVERSHRIDHEEFWSRQQFTDFETATATLRQWEMRYNYERLSLAREPEGDTQLLSVTGHGRRAWGRRTPGKRVTEPRPVRSATGGGARSPDANAPGTTLLGRSRAPPLRQCLGEDGSSDRALNDRAL